MDTYQLVWDRPSRDSAGSMPLGNGELGLNVWAEEGGDLLFYLSRTDAWCENARLLKLGRVRVKVGESPLGAARPFAQVLDLKQGEIRLQAGEVRLCLWVDAHRPVARVEVEAPFPVAVQVELELWRQTARALEGRERLSAYGLCDAPFPVIADPDDLLEAGPGRLAWCHHNRRSVWPQIMAIQGMGEWAARAQDPLLHRTFGGLIAGEGLVRTGPQALRSEAPRRRQLIEIHTHTGQYLEPAAWLAALVGQAAAGPPAEEAQVAHRRWWAGFWSRSHIHVSGTPEAETVSRGYALQRFVTACGGRGAYPIKFNGSIFTVDSREPDEPYDADYRRWGGPYWFQNTRLAYWPLLGSGDFEMLHPLFRMFADGLPFARACTQRYFGHEGAFFPETMYFWGAYATDNYGWQREGKHPSQVDNTYIGRYWQNNLELVALMLDYVRYTGDARFAAQTLLPLAEELVGFYPAHYGRDAQGRLRLDPAQSLETDQQVVNPAPDIAGLQWVLEALLMLPQISAAQQEKWRQLRASLPPLPVGPSPEGEVLLTAGEVLAPPANSENPELYAIFPYRLFGVGRPGLELARRTWAQRRYPGNNGWRQDDTQAAMLGLTGEAARMLAGRFADHHPGSRFPAFWGPNFDWTPDQCHGGNGMRALQAMLVQEEAGRVHLFPAWPAAWEVEFRLHVPEGVVEGSYRPGGTPTGRLSGGAGQALQVGAPQ
ncbi:MAG: hypothetical protein IT369_15690 [Candidatus Latescibacteria bacterium]|nr:hypothetical protein [Candidatus Latescibacterota bacterium]